jgi:hypothetical protein
MDTAMRSYWHSSDKKYVAKLQGADRKLSANLTTIFALVTDNFSQGQSLLDVSDLWFSLRATARASRTHPRW